MGLSAFFSASEVAFFSLSQAQVNSLREEGGRAGRRAAQLLERPGRLLVTIFIWNELINVSIAAVSTMLALQIFGSKAAAVAVGLSAFLIVVLGDITPKSFALKYSTDYAMFSALPMGLFCAAVSPAQVLITWMVSKFVAPVSPPGSGPSSAITEDEFRTILHRGEDKGIIESEEKEMIINVFELGDTRATEIMTPRTEIFALEVGEGPASMARAARSSHFSRIPVYRRNIDDVIGVLYTKDLVYSAAAATDKVLRPPFFIPNTKKVDELLRDFRRNKNHMAIILNEFGGVEGLVTLDDILTYVVGDESGPKGLENFERVGHGAYTASGRMSVETFNDRFSTNLSHEGVGTIGGFVFHLFGRVPRWGESIEHDGVKFTVKKLRGTIISELLVEVPESGGPGAEAE